MKLLIVLAGLCFAIACQLSEEQIVLRELPTQNTDVLSLNEEQAVQFAEKFIAENGYTDVAPKKDHLTYESIEGYSTDDAILKARFNTLERKAYGIRSGRKQGVPGWTVVFRYRTYRDGMNKKNGRAVTMGPDGESPRVEHVDFILSAVEKKF